jgi:AcrR family transcriptional regulator
MSTAERQRMPRTQREALMLKVAYRAFAEQGYGGVSMNELAQRAGVTKPMLYAYFGSKDGLYAACVRAMVKPNLNALSEAVRPGLAPDRQLWAGILAQLTLIEENREEWRVFVREALARGGAPAAAVAEGRRKIVALLTEMLERSLREQTGGAPAREEIELQATALQGAVEAIAAWWEEHPAEAKEALALRVMNFAWQGFANIINGRVWLPEAPTQ